MAKKSPEAQASEEAQNRTEVDNPANQVQAEDAGASEAGESSDAPVLEDQPQDEPTPTEVFEVQVNRKFSGKLVEIEGLYFYKDNTINAANGTSSLNDLEYDRISKIKEPEQGFQYIVKKPQGGGN